MPLECIRCIIYYIFLSDGLNFWVAMIYALMSLLMLTTVAMTLVSSSFHITFIAVVDTSV